MTDEEIYNKLIEGFETLTYQFTASIEEWREDVPPERKTIWLRREVPFLRNRLDDFWLLVDSLGIGPYPEDEDEELSAPGS